MVVLLNVMCMLHTADSKPIDMTAATTLDKCYGNTLMYCPPMGYQFFCNLETQACNACYSLCHSRQWICTCTTSMSKGRIYHVFTN